MGPFLSLLDGISPRLARAARRATQRRALLHDLCELGPAESGRVLRDVGLSPGDEVRLAHGNLDRPDLLPRLMRRCGLDPRQIARELPDAMQDLRRTCAMCADATKCARQLDRSDAPRLLDFCPNGDALAALRQTAVGAAPDATSGVKAPQGGLVAQNDAAVRGQRDDAVALELR